MATSKEDYERPLKELYESFNDSTRISVDKDIYNIWKYFILWSSFLVISFVFTIVWIKFVLIHEELGKRIQRAGSIIPLFAIFGETVFLIKINKISSVIHPARLAPEIYKERRFKLLKYISLYLTFFLIFLGAILSGYGDLLNI